MGNQLDAKNQKILTDRIALRDAIPGPRVGDFIKMMDGSLQRFSHEWDDGLQTSVSGSFYLSKSGKGSFSGGLNPVVPFENVKPTSETKEGCFWFFKDDWWAAFNDILCSVECRVFVQIEKGE